MGRAEANLQTPCRNLYARTDSAWEEKLVFCYYRCDGDFLLAPVGILVKVDSP